MKQNQNPPTHGSQGQVVLDVSLESGLQKQALLTYTAGRHPKVTLTDMEDSTKAVSFRTGYHDFGKKSSKIFSLSPVSPAFSEAVGEKTYDRLLKGNYVDNSSWQKDMVDRVAPRIIEAAEEYMKSQGREEELKGKRWEFNVVRNPADPGYANALTLPGGRIAVFAGMFDNVVRSDDDLAVILGHEAAHELNRDTAITEMKTKNAATISSYLSGDTGITEKDIKSMPLSEMSRTDILADRREMERQADALGLVLARNAGYDISSAGRVFDKISEVSDKDKDNILLIDHPQSMSRVQDLRYAGNMLRFGFSPVLPTLNEKTGNRITSALEKLYGEKVEDWTQRKSDSTILRSTTNRLMEGDLMIFPKAVGQYHPEPLQYSLSATGTSGRMDVTVNDEDEKRLFTFKTSLEDFNKDLKKAVFSRYGEGSHYALTYSPDNEYGKEDLLSSDYILISRAPGMTDIRLDNGEVVDSYFINTLTGAAAFIAADKDLERKSFFKDSFSSPVYQADKSDEKAFEEKCAVLILGKDNYEKMKEEDDSADEKESQDRIVEIKSNGDDVDLEDLKRKMQESLKRLRDESKTENSPGENIAEDESDPEQASRQAGSLADAMRHSAMGAYEDISKEEDISKQVNIRIR